MPPGTRVLIAELAGVGRDYPLSIEKLCPVLSFYVVSDWREGCERCKQILRYGGMGHTMSIHSRNDDVILQFGLKKPAFRIVVNYADDARVDRADDRARSVDDARVRRLRRQHHVRQHLAAAPAEHQAARLRNHPGCLCRATSSRRPSARRRCQRPRRRRRAAAGLRPEPLARRIDIPRVAGIRAARLSNPSPLAATGTGDAIRPRRAPAEPAVAAAAKPADHAKRPLTSSAKTTSGRPCGRAARLSSASERSSRRRRATSASSTGSSSRPAGRAERHGC